MRIIVAIPTVGRPEVVRRVVDQLAFQSRRPDAVIVVTPRPQDIAGLDRSAMCPQILFSELGLCKQRNRALEEIRNRCDVVLFLDDDFIPAADYLAELEKIFARDAEVVGTTGVVIADGIGHSGYSFDEAVALVEGDRTPDAPTEETERALYGCNMAIRISALDQLRFDEALPLYGWLEDIDVTYQLGRRGRLVRSERLRGVHMGAKSGRTSGLRLGYSQIANPIYLLRKGSVPPPLAWQMMGRNLLANMFGSIRPERHVDRRGRLRGNLRAIADLATARLDPRNVLRMK